MEKLLIHYDPQKHESFYVDQRFYELMSCRKKARESKGPLPQGALFVVESDFESFQTARREPTFRYQLIEAKEASIKKCWHCQYSKRCAPFLSSLNILRTLKGLG